MARDTNGMKATISVYEEGNGRLHREVTGPMELGYNDEVEIRIPEIERMFRVSLFSNSKVYLGKDVYRELAKASDSETRHSQTVHTEAIVEETGNDWHDNQDNDTENRWERFKTLSARFL